MTYFYRYDNGTVTYYLPEHEARRRYDALDHEAANLIGTFEQGFTYYLQAHGRVVQVHARPITADRVPELVRLQLAADFPPPPPAPCRAGSCPAARGPPPQGGGGKTPAAAARPALR